VHRGAICNKKVVRGAAAPLAPTMAPPLPWTPQMKGWTESILHMAIPPLPFIGLVAPPPMPLHYSLVGSVPEANLRSFEAAYFKIF